MCEFQRIVAQPQRSYNLFTLCTGGIPCLNPHLLIVLAIVRLVAPGYGAMQLAGPGVFGPPADEAKALQVLRDVIAAGVRHIDTSDFLWPSRYQ